MQKGTKEIGVCTGIREKDGHEIPIATYKIDTTLIDVKANTFIDSTGTIVT